MDKQKPTELDYLLREGFPLETLERLEHSSGLSVREIAEGVRSLRQGGQSMAQILSSYGVEPDSAAGDALLARPASDFSEEKLEFLWYPYIPMGDYTVLMAPGGTGKTYACCAVAAAVSRGVALPGDRQVKPPAGRVLFLSAEDRGSLLRKRLQSCGADLDQVFLVDAEASQGLNMDTGYEQFRRVICSYEPRLVVIDPWHGFLGERVDINKVNAVRPVFHRLSNLAKACSTAMLLISHVNKRSQGENANNAATGSVDFINAARSALLLYPDELPDGRLLIHTKTNYAPPGRTVRLHIGDSGAWFDGFSDVDRGELERAARQHKTVFELRQREQEARNWDREALVDALKEEANPFAPVRLSYEELRSRYGGGIYGGLQPKQALEQVKPQLEEQGIFLRPGINVRRQERTLRGFLLQSQEQEPVQLGM